MSKNFFDKFRISHESEDYDTVLVAINNGINFRGTNLWILIFAIFVASLGLNVNSTAVIIGAMLISPLMGPIMGIGLGIGITDLPLLKRALYNYAVAIIVALTTSTVFFLLSPLNDAHSEILSRTAPNIYDVLIALFGGFAGIIATNSKQKGNVIPGVAIATALMPPLCTAGYGLATWQFNFFLGAFYLFIINTVFIALATLITIRILRFPYHYSRDKKSEKIARSVIGVVVLLTLLPSLYFGYDMVQQKRFSDSANRFISNEAHFSNDYLLNKKVDAKNKIITLVFGGKQISEEDISSLRTNLKKYEIDNATLEVKQGFAYLSDEKNEQINNLSAILSESESRGALLQKQVDSFYAEQQLGLQIYKELKAQYNFLTNAIIQPTVIYNDSSKVKSYLILLSGTRKVPEKEMKKLHEWLMVRLKENNVKIIFQKL